MSDYEIGYGKPPRNGRFKPGVSGNPKGRPKGGPLVAEEIITRVLNAPMTYHDRGRAKIATRQELIIKHLVDRAVACDTRAAEDVLKFRTYAQRFGSVGSERLEVSDWLPDYGGQTGQQKTKDLLEKGVADRADDVGLDSNQVTEAHQGPGPVSD